MNRSGSLRAGFLGGLCAAKLIRDLSYLFEETP
jgi:hypothetical protein